MPDLQIHRNINFPEYTVLLRWSSSTRTLLKEILANSSFHPVTCNNGTIKV